MRVFCKRCGAKMIKDGYYYVCPTCRELPLKEADKLKDPMDWQDNIEGKIDLEIAIKRLPARQKKIATLLKEGYSQQEIADRLGLSQQTISSEISKISKSDV